jgi:hypothetical protein
MHNSANPARATSTSGLRLGKITRKTDVRTAMTPSSTATFARTLVIRMFIAAPIDARLLHPRAEEDIEKLGGG